MPTLLCDIGNTYIHFYYEGRIWKESPSSISLKKPDVEIYYISVNEKNTAKLLGSHKKCFDISKCLDLDTGYVGLGADRKASCASIYDGIVVDAGSAITVDVMHDGMHLGGYIMPGIMNYTDTYKSISPVLNIPFDMSVDMDKLPQSTREAVSFGAIKSIVLMIENSAKSKKIYFTGGDGKYLSRFFQNSIYDGTLVFKGMQKALEKFKSQ